MNRKFAIISILILILPTLAIGLAGCPKPPVLNGSATITIDDGTSPLEGASVSLNGQIGNTDATGQITFQDVPPGTYQVSAAKEGYTGSTASITVVSEQTVAATLSLTRQTGNVTITVDDGENPLEGASVLLNGVTATTDLLGQASFTVPTGTYTATVSKDGYTDNSTEITVVFETPASASISLTRQTGQATITVDDGTLPLENASIQMNGETKSTNAAGQATFTNIPTGSCALSVSATGYTGVTENVTITHNATTSATISLTRQTGNATITVNVGTTPISGANVTLHGVTRTTNAEGQASFSNVPTGNYTATASADGYNSGTANVTVGHNTTVSATISLVRQTGSATITVNDGTNPINGASVVLNGVTRSTNASGQTTFTNVPTGLYSVAATATGYSSGTGNVTVSYNTTVTATLSLTRQTGNVSVWVFDHSNFGSVGNTSMSNVPVTMNGQTVNTNMQGCANFTNVPTGTYTAVASYTGFVTNSVSVTVTSGKALDTSYGPGSYTILLDKPVAGQILITVLRNNGSPLVGATVTLNDQSPARSAVTNSAGQVTFNNVTNGDWGGLVTPANYLYPMTYSITVTETEVSFVVTSIWW